MRGNRNRRRRYGHGRRKRSKGIFLKIIITFIGGAIIAGAAAGACFLYRRSIRVSPEELLVAYMEHIPLQEYDEMYEMLSLEASDNISREDFIERNLAIYEGIEISNLTVTVLSYDKECGAVSYETAFDTAAGKIGFTGKAFFLEEEDGYGLAWDDSLIFPDLCATDKVRVSVTEAKRGEIFDRNGVMLAGAGVASSVGIVPGKLEDRDAAIEEMAVLLEMEPESIEKKLSAKWVKDDYFVPLQTRLKIEDTDFLGMEADEELLLEKECQEQLLKIPGVMLSDVEVREYPLGEAASHLTGYVQNVTAEDLEKHAGEGYTANSVIGRSGMESLFEKELKGKNGCRIYIVDADGNEKEELASLPVEDGQDIRLTIDAGLQLSLYEAFKEDKSCSVAMEPYTGEVLALVSTPSYDSNDFIMGLSSKEWDALNEDEGRPLFNRFRQTWCPGSSLKPVIAAIGLESGAVGYTEDFGGAGLSWQKDSSWGGYYITTLHAYEPVIMENALIYSDNIYFAKAALKIGAAKLEDALMNLGFGDKLPFEIVMQQSQYANVEHIESEIQLADSGYGQGEVLVNPLHLACLYTAFCNGGNIIKPYLTFREEAVAEYWIPAAFSEETADTLLGALIKIVNDANGTGYKAHREDVLLAGKTGTAEIKDSKADNSGTELGWFAVLTADKEQEKPVLIVSMVEDVKGRGGSGYVVEKEKQVLEDWFGSGENFVATYEETVREAITACQTAPEQPFVGQPLHLGTIRYIVNRLGEHGYTAIDDGNQADMAQARQLMLFHESVNAKTEDDMTVIEVNDTGGFASYGLHTENGRVDVNKSYYAWEEGKARKMAAGSYTADDWQYTADGYIMFSGVWLSQELYVLMLGEEEEHTAFRVQPLDETCRELNRKYILPIGYHQNNMFVTDWDETDYGELDFYDIFDYFYPIEMGKKSPYIADKNPNVGAVYDIFPQEFESVIMSCFRIDSETLQAKTDYDAKKGTYTYKPRGLYEAGFSNVPYPEVTAYRENSDRTITLTVHAVFPYEGLSTVFAHEVTIRPLGNGKVEYVSNHILSSTDSYEETWYTPRLTDTEWEQVYAYGQ